MSHCIFATSLSIFLSFLQQFFLTLILWLFALSGCHTTYFWFCLSLNLSVIVSVCPSVFYVFLSYCLIVFLSVCLSVFTCFCSSVFLSVCFSVFLSVCISAFLCLRVCACLVFLSFYFSFMLYKNASAFSLSICLSYWLFVLLQETKQFSRSVFLFFCPFELKCFCL